MKNGIFPTYFIVSFILASNQEDERGLTGARDTERKSNDELVAEVFHLREKLAAADEAFIRIESDNREAQAMSANLRDEVLRKKNDLIKGKISNIRKILKCFFNK